MRPGIPDGAKLMADRKSLVLERLVRWAWYTCDVRRMDLARHAAGPAGQGPGWPPRQAVVTHQPGTWRGPLADGRGSGRWRRGDRGGRRACRHRWAGAD